MIVGQSNLKPFCQDVCCDRGPKLVTALLSECVIHIAGDYTDSRKESKSKRCEKTAMVKMLCVAQKKMYST